MRYYLITEDALALAGMRLAGVEGELVADAAAAEESIGRVCSMPDVAVLLVTPGVVSLCPDTVRQRKLLGRAPLLAVIPGSDGAGMGADSIPETIRKAIGVKL